MPPVGRPEFWLRLAISVILAPICFAIDSALRVFTIDTHVKICGNVIAWLL